VEEKARKIYEDYISILSPKEVYFGQKYVDLTMNDFVGVFFRYHWTHVSEK
jgi:hypothetical protein